jgi:hypothetical protein
MIRSGSSSDPPAAPASGLNRGLWSAGAALFSSSATLICCALPALMVAIGAGAALAGLVSTVPQLIWLSAHKEWVFAGAGLMLTLAGALQWQARRLPCPLDPALARLCTRTRRISAWVFGLAVLLYLLGALFAFVLPWWMMR